jgi:hypothetical protein
MGEHNKIMFFSHHYIRFSEKYICFSGCAKHNPRKPIGLRGMDFTLRAKCLLKHFASEKKISGISPTYFSEHTQLIELRLFGELE